MSVYKITFTSDFSAFDKYTLESDYETPQDYFRVNPDSTCLLVQERPNALYMVVYHKTASAVATHPWTRYAWTRQLASWGDMTQEDWEKAVRKFLTK